MKSCEFLVQNTEVLGRKKNVKKMRSPIANIRSSNVNARSLSHMKPEVLPFSGASRMAVPSIISLSLVTLFFTCRSEQRKCRVKPQGGEIL
jgi:hypothetical protein